MSDDPAISGSNDDFVIRVRGLVTRFGEQIVHDGLDLDVRRGEVLGVVGGSGSGKSVLLRSVVGLRRPQGGSVEVLGRDVLHADALGLLGGFLMTYVTLGITLPNFLDQLRGAITSWTLWVGVIKAPFFAAIIAMVGCYEGFNVSGSAESVGRLTTQSVVESIFLVIVADAAFSVLFSILRI